ncbi:MAG: hypothetical protein JJT76_02705 [Clostridiaceae bacterium]|nr:hypothetical protein [Clostridiaceae bacterium]
MDIILVLLIVGVLVIDFLKLKKSNKMLLYLYVVIVGMALSVAIADNYDFFKESPLEMGIEKMQPITDWVEAQFD